MTSNSKKYDFAGSGETSSEGGILDVSNGHGECSGESSQAVSAGSEASGVARTMPPSTLTSSTVTQILEEWGQGDDQALEHLIPLVYAELRRLARYYFENEAPGHTLQPTALVNEVYLRLSQGEAGVISTRSQFFGFAARLMREILGSRPCSKGD